MTGKDLIQKIEDISAYAQDRPKRTFDLSMDERDAMILKALSREEGKQALGRAFAEPLYDLLFHDPNFVSYSSFNWVKWDLENQQNEDFWVSLESSVDEHE